MKQPWLVLAEIWRGTGNGLEAEAICNGNDRRGQACPSGTYGFKLTDQGGKHSTRVTWTLLR